MTRADVPLFRGHILFVSLNRQDTGSLLGSEDPEALAEATLGDWNLSVERSARVDCIVGVKNGLIVSIFETLKRDDNTTEFLRIENEKKGAHGRSRFSGHRRHDREHDLRGRSVAEGEKNALKDPTRRRVSVFRCDDLRAF